MPAPGEQASKNTRAAVVLSLQALGVPSTDVDRQRHVVAVWTKGRARRRSELTEREAGSLVARLRTMSREELADVLARPVPAADVEPDPAPEPRPRAVDPAACLATWDEPVAEEPGDPAHDDDAEHELAAAEQAPDAPELPPGVIACRPGTLTEHDAEQIRRFAEFLDQAGPAPSREELAAVADPEPAPDPPAPVVIPCEPPCEDVEAAADEAVRRFRERQDAGVIPEAPDLSSIPPRVPTVVPPRADRYCPPSICWCGTCPHWTPAPPVDYSKTPGSRDYETANRWR